MKNLILIFLSAAVLSAAPAGSGTAKQEVLAAMDAYKNAMVQKDGAALNKLLADDLTYVHSTGAFETKADVIKAITTVKTVVEKIEFLPDTTVRIHGNTAYVNGKVDYAKLREMAFFQKGIAQLHTVWKRQLRVALMCSEAKPQECHRSKLVGNTLVEQDIAVAHIDEAGEIKTQDEVNSILMGGQLVLFDEEPIITLNKKTGISRKKHERS